ncbi:16S rRNA (guanine(966)-N(2))-methyltransferase RsmD [Thalassotalea crassostreae]|uniref:16S rRNA (guanine(966)-N(2))-methyltransferase RsmD n=1 Tax=Thalassotalea crassostreae TaxID=1763536 RepID=UPI0008397F31|nr:16S rRNA (guanine(966)-N(2))-methyltransferase RsmD [Thalassotalea crassostreae]
MAKNRNNKAQNQQTGQVRIIAGIHRGRKLPVMLAEGLRPTTDRVKETVFNWLMSHVQQANCLDCYAGSGSLGFEALSRGAKQVTFFELNKHAAKQLKENLALLKANNGLVKPGACNDLLAVEQEGFDLVFIDPPFRKGFIQSTAASLEQNQLLTDNALIYVEAESELAAIEIPDNWKLLKEKVAGQVAYRLYQRS